MTCDISITLMVIIVEITSGQDAFSDIKHIVRINTQNPGECGTEYELITNTE
ncbi:285_t:CDS:2 [Funneliformis mosseae]|uniref:285_t:CDS:1 n=1 Tax=Funneliformis mosseae TaxID=27381 RepID=A0A9N9D6Y4_FUNMO|nr:285_t:CDS:2 [Funneliformis mosseae]